MAKWSNTLVLFHQGSNVKFYHDVTILTMSTTMLRFSFTTGTGETATVTTNCKFVLEEAIQ
jgi:hypothetical protein